MEGKKIKWGNIIIFLLIVAAAVAAYYYRNPDKNGSIFKWNVSKTGESEKTGAAGNGGEDAVTGSISGDNIKDLDKPLISDEFIMGLDSWIGGTPALLGISREYYRDYSLNFSIKFIPNDGDRIVALKDNLIQVTEMSLPSFIKFREKYPDSGVIIGITDFSRGADGIVAKSQVANLNDMEGRTVSYVADGTGKFILNKFLRLTGLRYQDITPIERKGMAEVIEDLKLGKADLIVSWSPDMNIAVRDINASSAGAVKMLITTKEVPDLVPTVLVVNKDTAENYPDRVLAFLKTWYISARYIIEKPDKAYDKLAELMNEKSEEYGDVTKSVVKDSLDNIKLMSLNDNFNYLGFSGNKEKFTTIINDTVQTWKKYGDISGSGIDASNMISFLFMKGLKDENDAELLVNALDSSITGNAMQNSDTKKVFKKQDEISIDRNTEKVATVDIPPVYYDSGKASVKAQSVPVLNEVLDIVNQFPGYYLVVDAHTDSIGSEESNLKLSKDRASEVKKYLVSRGVNPDRIVARGWGEYHPVVASEKNDADRAKNRRTEFILARDKTAK